ncbi:hypothetical protein I307_01731 [Cryptococcus deuterogattii 99/473]|uniref:Zn(2)-C6 fungal-type domain-containing protein n=1 Tax=Cryptococcus deuterogattii Ram5 TaxID=1296110 RepID=A0A0D0UUX5_9TREE|nr:hypothetical protein I309_04312 [Cryptococcus deuterogattii LA55]KIR39016.1 hypothetical protein I313_05165 [Cryptococcus deuterogattii Ram5]KIR76042.1 hypothetical protein I310_00749 [Cryptococcus deuterogattii CA1014]KIR95986.1 hypothetical protein I304_00751 [Cryptococcus deuterogattii CBS 10090]KIS02482.1 hypothetical protein L804_00752 [Cryptococcus deuterogattii 2001/935-1]KIY58929.1 hypothetical protein I307_01731 [Cryptococcus deuterogattii 99/473]
MSRSSSSAPKATGKARTKQGSLLAAVQLVPDGDKPYRRSRTGCLTCRKRKKKCPEQYEDNSCLRCKAGGWKCIREEDVSGGSSRSQMADTSPKTRGLPAIQQQQLQTHQRQLQKHQVIETGPSQIHQLQDAVRSPSDGASSERSSAQAAAQVYPNMDENSLSMAVHGASAGHSNLVGDYRSNFLPDNVWMDQPLDAILSATAPTFDISFYGSFGDPNAPDPFHFTPALDFDAADSGSGSVHRDSTFFDNLPSELALEHISSEEELLYDFLDAEEMVREATLLVRSPKDLNITMEAHFWALSDLHMAVGSFCDSSRAYAIMDLAEGLLALTYGLHPEVDFLSLNGYIPFYLRAFAMIDLNRSICQRRHTFFAFLETPQMGGVGFLNDGSHDQWFGLPAGLAVCLASLSNLIAEVRDPSCSLSSSDISSASKRIEANFKAYQSPFAVHDVSLDRHPIAWAAELSVETEIWRHLGLLLLWRLVDQQSVLTTPMRDTIHLVINLLKSLQYVSAPRVERENNVIDFWSLNYTTPAFLIGTLLVDRDDRAFCKRFLGKLGGEKNLEDMIVALETTWTATDRCGQVVDWFEECTRLDLAVTFF